VHVEDEVCDVPVEYVPAAHCVQALAPAADHVPAGQARHAESALAPALAE